MKIPTFGSFISFKFNGSTRDGPNSALFTVYSHWASFFFFLAAEVQIAIIGSLELGIYHRIYYKMILNTVRREPICYMYELVFPI